MVDMFGWKVIVVLCMLRLFVSVVKNWIEMFIGVLLGVVGLFVGCWL